jgi:hypothetical protein
MTTPVSCHDIVDFAFHTGETFILIALVMGALMALAELMRQPKSDNQERNIIDAAEIIRALKDAPVWFALFVAGGALLWLARDTLTLCH